MALAIGMDVGSTTVKAVVADAETREILWKDYRRHETRQPEMVLEFLVRIGNAFPDEGDIRIFLTGSGAGPLAGPLGGRFVQEVNAVTLAVERLHPDVNSVVELGGQDAKIIMFRDGGEESGGAGSGGAGSAGKAKGRVAQASMNDKCASGTGATIDKCRMKVGMEQSEMQTLRYDPSKLHHVAAKCGVFAETDIVNLVKSGIPAGEIMNSLADAIVHQNLSVLTRGSTLKPKVLLLGGPNTYMPFLVECWRHRIPETWEQRGYAWPRDVPVEELVFAPENAVYYAAFGAVLFGLAEALDATTGRYRGLDGLRDYMANGRSARLGASAAGPLVQTEEEKAAFIEAYRVPVFVPAALSPGQRVRAVIGLDGGSTSSKAVLVGEDGRVIFKSYRLSKGNPLQDTKDILTEIRSWVRGQGAELELLGFGATGYAAPVLEETLRADVNVVETVAHMMASTAFFPDADVICDIGGQDIKVLFLQPTAEGGREVRDFRLSNQCSAGNGMLLQAMADQFGVPLEQYADVAFSADLSPKFSYGCAVFLDADRVNFQKEGFSAPEMLSGLAQVLPKNVWQYVVQVPRLAEFGTVFVLQGGTQRNLAAVKAQVDYIAQRVPGAKIHVHPFCAEAGALGAAMETLRVVAKRGTRFVGIDAAIDLQYRSRNDESTKCHFCPNNCSRTFIDAETPDGRQSRYISGFSCEKGTVESVASLKVLQKERNRIREQFPNLLAEEAVLAFKHFFEPQPLPPEGASKRDVEVRQHALFRVARKVFQRGFARSHRDLSRYKVGIPRVLNLYSTAPFFRTYFETLGLPKENVVFSSATSEEMFQEGGRYGSIDPCYPSKVSQAHIHELLNHIHPDPRKGPLDAIFYPCLTHVPTWLTGTMDAASCPIVAGNPNVIKAAFTKEVDFFKKAGLEYIDASFSFAEPNLMKRKMFEVWGPRLGVTEDESDWACDQGHRALEAFGRILEEKGRLILDQAERDGKIAILVIGRPYHADPGLNHGIPEELQVLGYPILGIRSLPKDPLWLQRFFGRDDPLSIQDVWPENFSANSAQKVWAARFAARHPNVALLDLSSFKCGHDAPTYGIIASMIKASKTPYSALHDIDANKPSGSIAIRTKTYAWRLKRVEEELAEREDLRRELARRVAQKRLELEARRASPMSAK